MDIGALYDDWLLRIKLLQTFLHKSILNTCLYFYLCKYLGVELLCHVSYFPIYSLFAIITLFFILVSTAIREHD